MEPVAIGDLRSEYYDANSDFPGLWELDENRREDVDFRNSSSIRIWYNDLTSNYATHWHNALEIIIPIDNYYDVEVKGISYHLRPDEILIIPPGKLHQLTAPSSGSRFIYLLDISCLEGLKGFAGIKSLLTAPLFVTKESYSHIYEDVYDLLARMRNEYFRKNEYAELTIYALLINLFVKFGYNHIQTQDLFPNVRSYKQKEYVKKFNDLLDYIDKQYTGFTFCDYLCYRRIKAAELLLSRQELSITEVALQSGFSSISTFNRIFKQQKKCTPSEYRSRVNV
ncbi:MAG: helix-turn-helix domain-containing protein [Lachnospiraceae bacterium]